MKRALALSVLLAATLTACGNDDSALPQATPTPTPTPASSTSACPSTPAGTDLTKKPTVSLPAGSTTPADTVFTDVVVGSGPAAEAGSKVEVKYLGVLFSTCAEFDSSWSRGVDESFPFTVGMGVIPGFSKGATGMQAGGRRQVVIPAADGYGPQGTSGIPGGATLVFVIDLVSVS